MVRGRTTSETPPRVGFSHRHLTWKCTGRGRERENDVMRRTNQISVSLFQELKR